MRRRSSAAFRFARFSRGNEADEEEEEEEEEIIPWSVRLENLLCSEEAEKREDGGDVVVVVDDVEDVVEDAVFAEAEGAAIVAAADGGEMRDVSDPFETDEGEAAADDARGDRETFRVSKPEYLPPSSRRSTRLETFSGFIVSSASSSSSLLSSAWRFNDFGLTRPFFVWISVKSSLLMLSALFSFDFELKLFKFFSVLASTTCLLEFDDFNSGRFKLSKSFDLWKWLSRPFAFWTANNAKTLSSFCGFSPAPTSRG